MTTVTDKMKLYAKREISQAVKARSLQRRLGFVSTEAFINLKCDVGRKDVLRAEDIFDKDIGDFKAPIIRQDEKIEYLRQLEEQEAHCGIMFVNKR